MMTADDDGRLGGSPFQGFHAYADDSPRRDGRDDDFEAVAAPRRPIAYIPEPDVPPEAAAYGVFDEPAPRSARRPWGAMVAAGGVVLAVAAGLWLGLRDERTEDSVLASATGPNSALSVEVTKPSIPAAPPPPAAADRLEVLPPPDERAATAPPPVRVAPPPVATAAAEPAPAPSPQHITPPAPPKLAALPGPAPEAATAAPARDAFARSAAPSPASFACSDAPSRARAMVCADARLAALDRRMKRAYADAIEAGANEAVLRDDQADWMDIREDAARYSRGAVANVYRQRIDELERIADEGR